nr:response regulator [Bacteroidota bacterium]
MKPFKVLVVEDEFVVAMHLCDQLEDLGYDVLKSVTNYDDAVERLMHDKPDIAILDIKLLGNKTGIDLAKYINDNFPIPFIFLTSLNETRTFEQAKVVNPAAYLKKPFNREDLYRSIELALYKFHPGLETEGSQIGSDLASKDAFIIRKNNLFSKVRFTEITFAKSDHVYAQLYTADENNHLIRSSMTGLLDRLPENFIRIHRSYIVNKNFISDLTRQFVKIKGVKIPVGRSYLDKLQETFNTD